MLVTNETLAPLYLDRVRHLLEQAGVKVDSVILPDGEQYKSLTVLDTVFTALLQNRMVAIQHCLPGRRCCGRSDRLRGRKLSTWRSFYSNPDHVAVTGRLLCRRQNRSQPSARQNMIGAFYQPASVVVDLDCLKTLPTRELASGLAEVIKYGIILDGEFFNWLEENMDALLRPDEAKLAYCIRRCCELKAEVVAADERETGLRALLNLGHTFGHAIEAEMGYGNWLHGEAVAAGMVMAARTSERLGQFKPEETARIIALLERAGLSVTGPQEMSAQAYLPHMMRDKKYWQVRCVLYSRLQ